MATGVNGRFRPSTTDGCHVDGKLFVVETFKDFLENGNRLLVLIGCRKEAALERHLAAGVPDAAATSDHKVTPYCQPSRTGSLISGSKSGCPLMRMFSGSHSIVRPVRSTIAPKSTICVNGTA
ncbi:MAG: hypothetical protein M2R45_03139 [Verrucomicrobia subdivision 3 bacterium]|nr:hypothetical protein [Limisphaerales bacterium]MCS1413207.1 hypothetical protein [Limisphaerales bacterium]